MSALSAPLVSSHTVRGDTMRRFLITAASAALVAIVGAGVLAAPANAASKKPVKLEGKVNVHGTKDVSTKSSATIELEADDFYFSPTFIKAKAGEKLTFELENEGSATHTFTSEGLNIDEQVSPGKSTKFTLTVPSSGEAFRFYCQFHEGMGMQGAVFTRAGASVTTATSSGTNGSSGSNSTPGTLPAY
jgi:plastocyanin